MSSNSSARTRLARRALAAYVPLEAAAALALRSPHTAVKGDRYSKHTIFAVNGAASALALRLADSNQAAREGLPLSKGRAICGVCTMLAGAGFRLWSGLTLGRHFTTDVAVLEDHRIIEKGPYRLVRHPSYTGAVLAGVGFGILLGSRAGLAAAVLPSIAVFGYRTYLEEQLLQRELGEKYAAYSQRVPKRLIPLLF